MRRTVLGLLPLLLAACGDDGENSSQGAGSTADASSSSTTTSVTGSSSASGDATSSGSASSTTSSTAASSSTGGDGGAGGFGGAGGAGSDGSGGLPGFGGFGGAPECEDALCPAFGVHCDPRCGDTSGCEGFACDGGEEQLVLGLGRRGVTLPPIEEAHPDCAVDCPQALFTLKLGLENGGPGETGCLAWSTPYGVRVEIVSNDPDEPPVPACPTDEASVCEEALVFAADAQSFALVSVVVPADFARVVVLEQVMGDCDELLPPSCETAGCNGSGE